MSAASGPADRDGYVLKPEFFTSAPAIPSFVAGSAFVLSRPGASALLVSCQHLFGPAGGIDPPVPPASMHGFARSVALRSAFDDRVLGSAGAARLVAGADGGDATRDVCAFEKPSADLLRLAPRTTPLAKSEPLWLAGRVRAGAPPTQRLHAGRFATTLEDGLLVLQLADPELVLGGTSGAPALDAEARCVGMHVRFAKSGDGALGAFLLPVARILELLSNIH